MGISLESIIKAGVSGACSIYLVCTGIVLLVPGIALSIIKFGDNNTGEWGTQFEGIGQKVSGFAILLPILGFLLCCYACKKVERESIKRSHQGVVYSQTP